MVRRPRRRRLCGGIDRLEGIERLSVGLPQRHLARCGRPTISSGGLRPARQATATTSLLEGYRGHRAPRQRPATATTLRPAAPRP
ncbi:MAG: hypothetical protein MZW92_55220 [Comamonadaceae bacterium]|nr:hypothetical protein [Comamonadaceae bacterium]